MGGYFQKNRRVGDTKDGAGRAARSNTGHEKVDVASLASTKKRQAAEKAGDNQIQKKRWTSRRRVDRRECGEDQGGRGSREYYRHRGVEEGTGRPGCRSKYWAREDPRGELYVSREGFP